MAKQQSGQKPATATGNGGDQPAAQQVAVQRAGQPAAGNPGNLPAPVGADHQSLVDQPRGAQIVIADVADYQLIGGSGDGQAREIAQALIENVGGAQFSPFDLQRISVPAGGGNFWSVPDAETGKIKPVEELIGVMIQFRDQKSFWAMSLDESRAAGKSKQPPDCYSLDLVKGHGTPGVACAECPNNKFGTARKGAGKGKACKDVRLILFIRPEDLVPIVIACPPTSLSNMRKFNTQLAARGLLYYTAVVGLSLTTVSGDGNPYSVIVPRLLAKVPPTAKPTCAGLSRAFGQLIGKVSILDQEIVEGGAFVQLGSTPRNAQETAAIGEGGDPGVDHETAGVGEDTAPQGAGAGDRSL